MAKKKTYMEKMTEKYGIGNNAVSANNGSDISYMESMEAKYGIKKRSDVSGAAVYKPNPLKQKKAQMTFEQLKIQEENKNKAARQAQLKRIKVDPEELKKFSGQSIRSQSVDDYVANRVNESYKPTIKEQIKNANRNSMSSGSFGKILTPALKSTGNPTGKDPDKLYRTDDMSEDTRKAYRSAALKDKHNPTTKDAAYGDYMTDAEKNRYNEIYGVYGADQAEEYRNLILDDINKRKATRNYYSEIKGTNPIAKTAYQFGAGVGSGLRGIADSGAAIIGLENTHAKSVRDYKTELIRSDQDNGAIANAAYDIASSTGYMLPGMVTGAVLGGGVGNAVFALAQYGNTYRDDLHEGRNASGSQLHAMQQGIDETATNWLLGGIGAFGGGRLKELVAKTPVGTAVKDAIGKLTNNPTTRSLLLNAADAIADMGSEAAQEYTQYYTNAITENILFYADNDLSLTNSEAWYSALLGGLNALVLNLPGNVAKSADIVREGKTAANAPAGAEAQNISKVAGSTTSPETPNAANVFAGNVEKSGITGADTQKQDASALGQTAAATNQGARATDQRTPAYNPGNMAAEAEAQQQTSVQQSANSTEETTQPTQNNDEEYTEQTAHETNNELPAAAETATASTQTTQGGDIQYSEQIAHDTETEQPKAADAAHVVDESQIRENKEGFKEYSTENSAGLYSTSSTDHMVNAYDGRADMDRYLDAYKRVYSAGFNGVDAETMNRAPSNIYLTTDQKLKAYEDGMRDSNLYRNRKMIYEKGEARTGGLTEGSELVGEGERKFLDWAGKKTGIKIKIEEGFKGVASIDLDKGIMRINPYAENFVASASHEFTHMIKQFSPKEYDALQRMTIEALMKSKNVSYEELYKKYEDQYRSQVNDEYTIEDILEEITADGATAYLNDAEFAENVARQNSSLAKKIADFFRDIADVLKQIINDRGVRSVGRVMRENAARYRTAANTWYQALEKSGNMYREGYSAKKNNEEKLQIKEFDDGSKYVFIDTDQKQFDGLDGENLRKKVREIINKRFSGKILGYKNNSPIVETERGAKEYAYSKKEEKYSDERIAKFRASTELNNLLEASVYTGSATYEEVKDRHPEALGGFDYYKTVFTLDNERFFEGTLNVMNQKRVSTLYDVTKIKSITQNGIHRTPYDVRGRISEDAYSDKISSANKNVNDKTKFQLSDPIEETKNLIAVRNVDQSALSSMLELEGMPSPSIAVTKADIGHTQFGDVTFIFGKDTIDPKRDSRNLVFDADAWTPTFNDQVHVDTEIKGKALEPIVKKWRDYQNKYGYSNMFHDIRLEPVNFEDYLKNSGGDINKLADSSYDLKLMYLDGIGKPYSELPKEIKTDPYIRGTDNKFIPALAKRLSDMREGLAESNASERTAFIKENREEIRNAYKEVTGTDLYDDETILPKKNMKVGDVLRGIKDYLNGTNMSETIIDTDAAKEAVDKAVDESEYHEWIKDTFKKVIGEKGIRNDKEYLTPSGNRRTFKQLHDAYTAENIVKALWSGKEQGAVTGAGFSSRSVRGASARKLSSIEEMHQASGRLQAISGDDMFSKNQDALFDDLTARLYNVRENIDKRRGSGLNSSKDAHSVILDEESYNEAVVNAATKAKTAADVKRIFKREYINITDAEAKELLDIYNGLREIPTDYFEAKPKRVVDWSEIKLAVVPDNIDTRLIDQLQDRGVRKIETYPAGDNAARLEAENKATDLRFQLNIDDDDPAWSYYENIVRSSSPELQTATDTLGELLSAVDYMPSDKAIERTAKKLKKYTATDTSVDEIKTELKSLFSYIAYSNNINGSDISDIAADYAGRLIENNVKAEVDPAEARAYREYRNALKGYTFHMPEGYAGEVDTLGGLQKLRRMAPGVLNITKDKGISIDTMYQELTEQYPDMFDPEVYNPGDQLDYIVDKLSMLKPKPKVSYANEKDFDAYRYYAGQEIFKAYIAEGAAEAASKTEYKKLKQQYNKELKANAKTEKEMAALQSKAAEMQARYIEQLNISRKKIDRQTSQNRVYEARKSIKTRYWKDQILKDARELSTWMLKPTDAKHVPEALKAPLANFLNELDLTSRNPAADGGPTQRTVYWMELKDAWANIAKNGGRAEGENSTQYMYIDEDILEKMSELTDRIKGIKKLEDLDYIDVLKLSDVMKGMKHAIENANKMITLNRSVDAVSRGTLDHLQKLKTKTKRAGLFGVPSDVMFNRMLDAGTRFHTLGRDAEAVYQEVRKGFNRKVQHTAEAAQMFSELKEKTGFTDKEINDWKYRKAYDVKINSGETIHISTGQAMNLYNLMKREQARDHVLRGGITLTSVKLNGKNLTGKLTESKNVHVDQSDVLSIIGQLTPKEKMFADGLAEIMQKTSDWGNETSMQLMGYKKFRDSHYWPIKSSKDYISNTLDQAAMGGLDKTSVKNAGPTKSTVKHANNPILVGDAIDVWSEHVNFMANYNAFAASLTDLNKWYNYIDMGDIRNPDEVKYKGSVKQEIKRTFGSEANDFIMRFIEDVNGSGERDTSPFNAAISLFKGSAVGANLSVAIQQPTAIFRAVAVMDPEFLGKGLTHKSTADWDTIKKYSAIAQWKDWGFYETDTGKSMKSILTGQDTWIEKLNEKQMWLAGKCDEITWKRIWAAAEQQVMTQQPKLEAGSEAFYKATAEVFDNVIDQTQVVDSVFTKSDLMRSKNALNKMNTAFFAEPTKSYDMLYRALYDWRTADSPEAKKTAAKQLTRSLMAFILSNAASAAAKSVVMAMRDKGEDRDKDFWDRWWSHFTSEFWSNIFLPNYMVWVKDAISLLTGYDIERPDLQGVVDLGYVVKRWISYYKGESRYTFGNNILYTTKAFSSTTGIGFYAAQRDINAAIDTMFEAMGLDAAAYEKDKLLGYDIGSSKNTKYYLSKAIAAYRKDHKGLGDQIIGDMLKAGIPEDKIDTEEKNLLKDDPKFSGLLDATISGDTDTADKAKQELIRDGYREEIVDKTVENSVGNYAKNNGYAYGSLNDTLNSITNYKKEGFKDFNDKYKEWARLQNIKNGWDAKKCKEQFRTNCTKYFKPLYKEGDSSERSRILNILSRVKTTEGETIYPNDDDILAWGKE